VLLCGPFALNRSNRSAACGYPHLSSAVRQDQAHSIPQALPEKLRMSVPNSPRYRNGEDCPTLGALALQDATPRNSFATAARSRAEIVHA